MGPPAHARGGAARSRAPAACRQACGSGGCCGHGPTASLWLPPSPSAGLSPSAMVWSSVVPTRPRQESTVVLLRIARSRASPRRLWWSADRPSSGDPRPSCSKPATLDCSIDSVNARPLSFQEGPTQRVLPLSEHHAISSAQRTGATLEGPPRHAADTSRWSGLMGISPSAVVLDKASCWQMATCELPAHSPFMA